MATAVLRGQTAVPELAPAIAPAPVNVASSPSGSPVPTGSFPAAEPVSTTHERLSWLFIENLGWGSVGDDFLVGAVDTYFNSPNEYKTHWQGFGERSGMIAANYGVKSVMEASLGSIWGEDPRYFRTTGMSIKNRMAYVIKETFLARNRAGSSMPAYSRYIAFPASSFLMNAWSPASEATKTDAVVRVGLGFLSRMGENAWKEFIVPRK